ncbi:MAG: PHP domain-containing protein [Actinomycetota bacterium]|nr:PHP domain-containing protein [Actinomycetota bacterium]
MHERPRSTLLLCELHSHTTWSDGALTPRALVDLYGEHGFDVLCITDHTHRSGHPGWRGIPAERFSFYVQELEREAVRARELYDLILIPGAELTDGNDDPARSGHALAVGLREFVSLDAGLPEALLTARAAGAALVAAHPSSGDDNGAGLRAPTRLFWQEREALTELVDRFELVNRHQAFAWVAEERLPAVATATSTGSSTCSPGRRCCPAPGARMQSSTASAPTPART